MHQDSNFSKLVSELQERDIVEIDSGEHAKQIIIKKEEVIEQLLTNIFVLYSTPSDYEAIAVHEESQKIYVQSGDLEISFVDELDEDVANLLNTLLTGGDKSKVYEYAFNTLVAIYISSMARLEFVYPNTYIVELGNNSHEIDIFLGTCDKECIMVETTRGSDKETDRIDESYAWHFKKALFRKWLVERIYEIDVRLIYITVKGHWLLNQQEQAPPDELEEEFAETEPTGDRTSLFDMILETENENVCILKLDSILACPDTFENIGVKLRKELIGGLSGYLNQ